MKRSGHLAVVILFTPLFILYSQMGSVPVIGNSGSPLRDPGIRSGEESRYSTTVDGEVLYSQLNIRILAEEDAYQFKDTSSEKSDTLIVSQRGFVPIRGETITRRSNSEYSEARQVIRPPMIEQDEILILAIENLPHLLRGYPFSNPRDLLVRTLSAEQDDDSGFAVRIKYRGEEMLRVNGVSYRAHKLELVIELPGIAALFASAIPKSYFWYENHSSHRLLRSEGIDDFNFGGESSTFVSELISTRYSEPK